MKDAPITITLNKTEQQAILIALHHLNHSMRNEAEWSAQVSNPEGSAERAAGLLGEAGKVEAIMVRIKELNP